MPPIKNQVKVEVKVEKNLNLSDRCGGAKVCNLHPDWGCAIT
jgi:hypothetical protein